MPSATPMNGDGTYYITIPAPLWIPPMRGYESTRARAPFAFRITLREREQLEQAARKRGIPASNFARWCIVHCSHAVLHNDPDKDKGNGEVHYDPAFEG